MKQETPHGLVAELEFIKAELERITLPAAFLLLDDDGLARARRLALDCFQTHTLRNVLLDEKLRRRFTGKPVD